MVAVSRTMILLDPDLGPDLVPDLSPRSPVAKPSSAPTANSSSQRDRVPSARALARFLHEAQAAVGLRGQVSVLLTTDAALRTLNRRFRGKNRTTDVLSFPAEGPAAGEVAGDLAIGVPAARRQSAEYGHSLGTELKVLMLHGLLHLAGYDHENDGGRMARRERQLRQRLRLPVGLIERAGSPARSPEKGRKPATRRARSSPMRRKNKDAPNLEQPRVAAGERRTRQERSSEWRAMKGDRP